MTMRLIVGCPLSHRGWIIRQWFEHVSDACKTAGVESDEVRFIFIGDTTADLPMWDYVRLYNSEIIHVDEARGTDTRTWNWSRYETMSMLRNRLLTAVRDAEPDMFLSLDSDILLDHLALLDGMVLLNQHRYDAVGLGTYMTRKGTACPNHGIFTREGQIRRSDWRGHGLVDVIMAAKLMLPRAYKVDYAPSRLGEDIGWSKNAADAALQLGWDGRNMSRHVMDPSALSAVDPRVPV